jgi:PAS domain S-box-containing protein
MSEVNILVVEDESIVALDIAQQLKSLGYGVSGIASSGSDAIRQTTNTSPDLILMDIRIKGDKDGIETAQEIRDIFNIPVIFLTAYADHDTLQRAKLTAPFGYILKPFTPNSLQSIIEIALHKHKMEEQLRESERRFRTLTEMNPAMTLICQEAAANSVHQIIYANPAAQAITGYTTEELSTPGCLDTIHQYFEPSLAQGIEAFSKGQSSFSFEVKIVNKNNEERCLDCTLGQINYGGRQALLLTAFDTTLRRRAAQQQEELSVERARHTLFKRFITDVAHDLKTPMTVIQTSAYLVEKQSDPVERQKSLDRLKSSAEHLELLLDDMFKMAHLDNITELELERESIDVKRLVQEIVGEQQSTELGESRSLDIIHGSITPIVFADKTLLKRAITNLVVNALNYTPPGGSVLVQTYLNDHEVGIQVRDTGIGITADDLPHIFERFYRSDLARSIVTGGSGLGLGITKRVVELHQGHIDVNASINVGSTFTIRLPNVNRARPGKKNT